MGSENSFEYEGTLTIVLQVLLGLVREQGETIDAERRSARNWERRAVLGTATLANQLVLRVREAEIREQALRRRIAELVHEPSQHQQEIRAELAAILSEPEP